MNKLSVFLLMSITLIMLSSIGIFGHDIVSVPAPATANFQAGFVIFPQFAIGINGDINYTSTIQITNANREKALDVKLTIHGTEATRFTADYTVNGRPDYSGYVIVNASVPPLGTKTLIFESDGPLKTGFVELNPVGDRIDEMSTSFFFQTHDVGTGELIDSVGVSPSDFGWHFVLPLVVSNDRGINTGVAYSHIPVSSLIQVVFELRGSAGEQLALEEYTILYPNNVWVYPYHRAQFVTEIFADFFADFDDRHRHTKGVVFHGSLHIYAQRNINVLALRTDTKNDGDIQLTSIPSSGELCIDGYNDADDCFKRDIYLDPGWVPIRKKSKNEIWLDNGGVCDKAGVCSP